MRYERQVVLDQIGEDGQHRLQNSRVCIVGLGALGCGTSQLLVRAGVGHVFLIDHDDVETVNLQRQILYDETDVGKKKVDVAMKKLQDMNTEVEIDGEDTLLSETNTEILEGFDLIFDCTDNMQTRQVINDFCKESGDTWIYAAGSKTEGNVLVVDDPERFSSVFRSGESFDRCEEVGVVNALTTVMASIQVTEGIKILVGEEPCTDLIRFDIWENKYEKISF